MKILVTDDSALSRKVTEDALVNLGHEVIVAKSGEEAIQLFQEEHPDLILLDVNMSGMNGFQCATEIRALDQNDWIPIIFLSSNIDDESIAQGIDAGGDDYLSKPFSKITLAAKIRSMERIANMRHKLLATTKLLEKLSSTDVLTNLYNRLQFDRTLHEVVAHSQRYHQNAALLIIDIDHFKTVNDTLGHPYGDMLLKEVSKRLTICLRANDFIARLGGDEFAIILRQVNNQTEAEDVADKIIKAFSPPFEIEGSLLQVTASIGIACYPAVANDPKTLMQNSDIALYNAKKAGRNQYQVFKAG